MDALDRQIKEYGEELTELLLPANLMDCFESFRRKQVGEAALPFHENELSWFLHLMNEFRGADDQKEDLTLLFDPMMYTCLLYTSDAADEEDSVDLGGRRI